MPSTLYNCSFCKREVRTRQCDFCHEWQHRVCTTGISSDYYRQLWRCYACCREDTPPRAHASIPVSPPAIQDVPDIDDLEFNVSSSFVTAEDVYEVTLEDDSEISDVDDMLDSDCDDEELPVTPAPVYEVVKGGSIKGGDLLVDNLGHAYCIKRRAKNRTEWRCKMHKQSDGSICRATVIENNGNFRPGLSTHNHFAVPGIATRIKVVTEVKRRAVANMSTTAPAIVREVLAEQDPSLPPGSRSVPEHLIRQTDRLRQRLRTVDPRTLDFDLRLDGIPEGFFRKDIQHKNARHLIFATKLQTDVLVKAKTWYMDATFKVVKAPFCQLFSVHAFVKGGDGALKQVPLAFVLMSRRGKGDYKKVLKTLKKIVGRPKVQHAVTDFKHAVWSALRSVFPGIRISGCVFHWKQAVMKKVASFGLKPLYLSKGAAYRLIRLVLSLPYLPAEHIASAFEQLKACTPSDILPFMEYVQRQWVSGSWSTSDWSIFGHSIRTKNDIEGWHKALNTAATQGNLHLYRLIELLHKEALNVRQNMTLVSEDKVRRHQRKRFREAAGKFHHLWSQYEEGCITTAQLLRSCAQD